MTIVGVSDEAQATIEKFVSEKEISYVIAAGGAREYETRGIPHAWLVAPDGNVAWEGHPASLKESEIEGFLKDVRLRPEFKLDKDLVKAERYLNAGFYAKGVKELERYIKRPKDDEIAAQARETIEKVAAYGSEQLAEAEKLLEGREYDVALAKLEELEEVFKGHEVGDKAKDRTKELEKDEALAAEIEAAAHINKAQKYIDAKSYKGAAVYLNKVVKGKKYADTEMRKKADEMLSKVMRKL